MSIAISIASPKFARSWRADWFRGNGLNLSDSELERTLLKRVTPFESGGDGEVGHFSLHSSGIGTTWSFSNLLFA